MELCAPTRTELLLVTYIRLDDAGVRYAKQFLRLEQIRTIPSDEALADTAADAYRRLGKGQHSVGLNFGDCFSYALAIRERMPLLFNGNVFSQTDILVADYPTS